MSTENEKVAGTNLTPIAEYTQTALALADLKHRFKDRVFESLETEAQRKAARKDIAEVRGYRTGLEDERKRIKAPALERCRLIDAEAKRLTEELRELEDPMKAQLDAKEAEIEAEKIKKAQAEQERVDNHRAGIQRLRDFPLSLQGKPSAVIESRISSFIETTLVIAWDFYEEFSKEAEDAYKAALFSAQEVLQRQHEYEAEQERVRQQDEENRKLREQIAAMEREAETRRLEDERRTQEEREASERKERERVHRIRTKINDLSHPFHGEQGAITLDVCNELTRKILEKSITVDEFCEFAGEAEEAKHFALETIEETYSRLEREEAERQQRENELQHMRELAEAQRLEQERLDRERAEHEAKVEADRLQALSLRSAAEAVVSFFPGGQYPVVDDLRFVLRGENVSVKPAKKSRK